LKLREVGFWENMERRFEELEEDFKLSHSGLNKLLAEDRGGLTSNTCVYFDANIVVAIYSIRSANNKV
jgi:hypothetical protein